MAVGLRGGWTADPTASGLGYRGLGFIGYKSLNWEYYLPIVSPCKELCLKS